MDDWKIPSKAEHDRLIKRLWQGCIMGAIGVFLTTGTTVLIMWRLGFDSKTIVNVSTIVFQIVLLPYGLGYVAPALATSLLKMALGVEMSRRGLEIGEKTANTMDGLEKNANSLFSDAKPMVKDMKEMVENFKKRDFAKLEDSVERVSKELDGGGKLDRLVVALEKIANRTSEKADDQLEGLLGEAWSEEPTSPPPAEAPPTEAPTTAAAPDRDGS